MKVAFYKDGIVLNIINDINNPKPIGDSVIWDGGEVSGIKNDFIILPDEENIEIGQSIPEDFLPNLKEFKKEIVNVNVRKACEKGFTSQTTGRTYETEGHDQTNFSRRMLTLLGDPNKDTVDWKTADGVIRRHTREEFLAVCNELDIFITAKVSKGWNIKNVEIENATTIKELESISLEVE
jgi:hypothetical protein